MEVVIWKSKDGSETDLCGDMGQDLPPTWCSAQGTSLIKCSGMSPILGLGLYSLAEFQQHL
jgi:hypothetical protein